MKRPRNIVGPTVRKLRSEKKISQPELAGRCQLIGWDISRDIIAKIEDQRRWVADFELFGLAKALEVEVHEILSSEKTALSRLRDS